MSAHPKIPMTHTTIERVDGSSAEVAHVDHAALFDQWDAFDNELWSLDAGDLHNVIDHARTRVVDLETRLAAWKADVRDASGDPMTARDSEMSVYGGGTS